MKSILAKIPLILLLSVLFSCNTTKRVGEGEYLLTKNTIYVDSVKTTNRSVHSQLYQQPNATLPLIRFPLRLFIYNAAKPDADSLFYDWLYKKPKREQRLTSLLSRKQLERLGQDYVDWQAFKMRIGEEPVVIQKEKAERSAERLKAWYWNYGWFNAKTSYKIDTISDKKAAIRYYVQRNQPYVLDSLTSHIESDVVDSLYQIAKSGSLIRKGQQFDARRFNWERSRLTNYFRNNGLYYFTQENITFNADTIDTGHRALIQTIISNREVRKRDTTYSIPYKIMHISDVNIFTNYVDENGLLPITDSIHYRDFTLFSSGKSQYKPKALTDAIFIKKGDVYKDLSRSQTYERMNDVGIFQYPDIKFMEDPRDSTQSSLIANVFLKSRKKHGVTYDLDVSRSNIQDFGIRIGGSLLVRNVFKGLEIFEVGARASIGSSRDASVGSQNQFFNISEIGGDMKINFPRVLLPFGLSGVIPKTMSPFTGLSAGMSLQKNIGLDKQNLTSKYSIRWKPDRRQNYQLGLVDLQYVRNLNPNNYFNIYRNSFDRLNKIAANYVDVLNPDYFEQENPVLSLSPKLKIPEGANAFLRELDEGFYFQLNPEEQREAATVMERKARLTENNLIFGSSFDYSINTRQNIYDRDFSQLRFHFEAMGNSLYLLSSVLKRDKGQDGEYHVSGVRFSQYLKAELDYIKHWDLGRQNILAVRAMGGIAIPYGNSNNIPFVRSFYAGGANDIRAWRPYDLGPGSSGGPNEFNEANMKLSFNLEYRFNLFASLNSAFFVDVGNIWNVLDNTKDERATFSRFSDLKELAVGSGFGFRYDFRFFVIRLDLGFKTYDPAYNKRKWLENYNFANSVLNVGINYPF